MTVLHIVPKFVAPGPSEFQASFWMQISPNYNPADQAEVSLNITDWLQDMYDIVIPMVRTVITATEYVCYVRDLLTGEDSELFTGNWTFAGTNSTDSQAPQVAATINARSLGSDRPAQKRMIPFTDNQMSEGILSAGTITNCLNFASQWTATRLPSANYTYTPGLVSKGSPQTFSAFTGVTAVNAAVGTVRSRKRGLGI